MRGSVKFQMDLNIGATQRRQAGHSAGFPQVEVIAAQVRSRRPSAARLVTTVMVLGQLVMALLLVRSGV